LFILTAGVLISHFGGWTDPFEGPVGYVLEGSVASLERIRLGGVKQAVLIRGRSVENPLLLYIHGGPGVPEMTLVRHYNAKIEDSFIVVSWDQRKAGKSYSPLIPGASLTVDRLVSDAFELIKILCNRFGKKKVVVLGHSWGSIIGIRLAQKHPTRVAAYIGMGQMVHVAESERLSHRFTLDAAGKLGNRRAVSALQRMKNDPRTGAGGLRDRAVQRRWLLRFGGLLRGVKASRIFLNTFFGHEYNLFDLFGFLAGKRASMRAMWKELLDVDLVRTAPELEVPVFFFMGRYDRYACPEPAEKYFETLQAPKKEMIWFEDSAHSPNIEEPEKFNEVMTRQILTILP
jgi:pimeloyl-ACP methyl ester carboxylesterase